MISAPLTDIQRASFERDGYIVVRGMERSSVCDQLQSIAKLHVEQLIAPIEYELDVRYPGAPVDSSSPGAQTSRRLLQVLARHEAYRAWATSDVIKLKLSELFARDETILLSQCHHNCMMTKAPGYSSVTLWHQDNRYWSFDRQDLVSVWLALAGENKHNGCLRVIPGSHKMDLDPGRFDASMFLRPDLAENKALISEAQFVELERGDVLFFHSRLFHAAGRNLTEQTKFSLVFTYHEQTNMPIEGTRSARFPSIAL